MPNPIVSPYPYVASDAVYRPDRFYRYGHLTALLEHWASEYPALASLEPIGHSHEGRAIWAMTLSNRATGSPETKPAYFVDANVHAGEVTGSAVALHTIHHVLAQYGSDERVTRLLDDFTLYVVPRVAVDGAEIYLTQAGSLRSSARPYPAEAARANAAIKLAGGAELWREDVNGDGHIACMRIEDPCGAWKVSPRDARLMVPRAPDESGGRYYWVLPEGSLAGYDPERDGPLAAIAVAPSPFGLDLNRNFPAHWDVEPDNPGGGPYPLSEPESRAIAEFLIAHPNIVGSQHYHTFSGVILRPSSRRPDSAFAKADLARYRAIGRLGSEETGYPCISLHDGFTEDPKKLYPGMLIDWAYDHRGLVTFSSELWSLGAAAGLSAAKDPLAFYFGDARSEEDELAMLRWCDERLGSFGFLAWTPWQHPQLGPVEIGGWQTKFAIQNAPGPVLEALCQEHTAFTLRALACSPRVRVRELAVEDLGDSLYRLRAVVENAGFLPTQGTDRAIALKILRPDRVAIALEAGASLVVGESEVEIGFLPGRDEQQVPFKVFPSHGVPTRRRVEWLVRAPLGARTVRVSVESDRGGRAAETLSLA